MEHSPSPKVKKLASFYGTRIFITVITWVRHFSLSYTESVQSTHFQPNFLRTSLMLSYHLLLGISGGLFPSWFPTTNLYTFRLSTIRATFPAHPILDYPNNVWRVPTITLLIMQSHPLSCYLFPLTPKCHPRHPILTLLSYPRSLFCLSVNISQ